MNSSDHLLFSLCFLCLWLLPSSSFSQDAAKGELLIQFKADQPIPAGQLPDFLSGESGFRYVKTVSQRFRVHLLSYDPGLLSADQAMERWKNHPAIQSVQHNPKAQIRGNDPNDPLFDQQWSLQKIQAPQAWEWSTGGVTALGDDIVVAVIDAGCSPEHPDLQSNLWTNADEIPNDGIDNDQNGFVDDYHGWNVADQNDSHPDIGHGCGVAGIIGARGNNELGTSGINWQVKIMQLSQAAYADEIIEAFGYVYEMRYKYNESQGREGAFVVAINYSAGFDYRTCDEFPIWADLMDSLGQIGVLTVAATTKNHENIDQVGDVPTDCPSDYLLAVTTSNQLDRKPADRFGYGTTNIDLAAPGVDIFSARSLSRSGAIGDGTSFATPMVSGAIGLLYGLPLPELAQLARDQPEETALLMRQAILRGVDHSTALERFVATGGRLNVFGSVLAVQEQFGGQVGELNLIQVRPNPATNSDQVEIFFQKPDLEAYDLQVFDALGRLMASGQIKAGFYQRSFLIKDLSRWPRGMYFVRIQNAKNFHTTPFLIQ
ncbi:MAG: S8/S53 family peptidase [Bacteroidota bacterium]